MEATAEDKINDFFHTRNTNISKEVSIRPAEFWDLMKTLEERISITTGRQAISALSKKPGVIYLRDFLHWWHDRHNYLKRNVDSETSGSVRSHIGLSSSKKSGANHKFVSACCFIALSLTIIFYL